ncbi:MAG: FIST C-terminal domain-containing protein [Neomegalonema sp.]|nr:FIST C-terminal domain-containing protein [Neomegalonema sp.]
MKIAVEKMTLAQNGQAGPASIDGAVNALARSLAGAPDFVLIQRSADARLDPAIQRISASFPNAALISSTSCIGAMTSVGECGFDGPGLALWGLRDPKGAYGAACVAFGDDPAAATREALSLAIERADRMGETPNIVWLHSTPGAEETILRVIGEEIGETAPIIGGSAADDAVSGKWSVSDGGPPEQAAVALAVLFPSTAPIAHSFQSGYAATARSGVVTDVDGRLIRAINDRPAAEVYNEWTAGLIDASLRGDDANVFVRTSLAPLGFEVGRIVGEGGCSAPYYKLIHPEAVTPEGGLATFADLATGDRVHLMSGSIDRLVARAGKAAEEAKLRFEVRTEDIAGALTIFCAGCMLTVGDDIRRAQQNVSAALGGAPFVSAFTFGEQGCFLGGENRHGNLMISNLIFTA